MLLLNAAQGIWLHFDKYMKIADRLYVDFCMVSDLAALRSDSSHISGFYVLRVIIFCQGCQGLRVS